MAEAGLDAADTLRAGAGAIDPSAPTGFARHAGTWLALALTAAIIVSAYAVHGLPSLGREASFTLLAGAAFGIILQRSRFCFFCIIRDALEGRDARPLMGLLTALAVGTVGSAVVFGAWIPDARAGHLPPVGNIGPVGWPLLPAGFAFGLGMAFSGSCISAHLYRLSEGSILSVTALVGSAAGFVLGYLIWNPAFLAGYASAPIIWLPAKVGFSGALILQLGFVLFLAWGAMRFLHRPVAAAAPRAASGLFDLLFRRRWNPVAGGAALGVISTALLLRAEPLGVTSAIARATRRLADRWELLPARLEGLDALRGCAAGPQGGWLSLNLILVAALLAGAALASAAGGHFAPKSEPLRRHASALGGGILLGAGSLIALGCTIGKFYSGITAFSLCGWVFAAAVLAGVAAGLRLRRLWW